MGSVLVHSRRHILRGVASQVMEANLPWTNHPLPESVPHLCGLTSLFTELVKNYKYSALHACMCTHCHVPTLCWLYPAEVNQRNRVRSAQRNWVHSRCKGTTVHCKCFKAKAECTLRCHGRNGGAQCINTAASAAPSGTFNLEQNTWSVPPELRPNQKRCWANAQGDACSHTDPSSAEDTANDSSDLTELDTEDEEVLEEEEVTGEEEEEEGGNEEWNDEDEPVSKIDMEHSVIIVASGRPRRNRL